MMKGKVLITGASRGIGRSIAERFAAEGYDLYLLCRNNIADLEKFAAELSKTSIITAKAFQCDVGDMESLKGVFAEIDDIDIVVNNAAVAWIGLLTDMEISDWKRLMSTNLDSLFYISKLSVPMMVKKHSGRIINISSVWGNVGASCEVAYSASKGGVNSFTKALAKELAPSGISVNAIACGVIDTDMNRQHLTDEDLEELRGEIPMDRLGNPSEVAELVLKVAQAPSYMTGQIITIDGGWI
ncbi:elongation factor P 5-aminopentanone reductase [Butyrivibrio sp. VCB2006]|uniref:elongation factor P 5-aminopentanone reductase n=1 Tax=Butyrivibrio sp. VCB2006 TaxID=1280679 RepID=UPI00040EFBF3|nr:SDR family NAD(P)-dependent oxidoreductase [Butyrivibrio sp. VCB2006]